MGGWEINELCGSIEHQHATSQEQTSSEFYKTCGKAGQPKQIMSQISPTSRETSTPAGLKGKAPKAEDLEPAHGRFCVVAHGSHNYCKFNGRHQLDERPPILAGQKPPTW